MAPVANRDAVRILTDVQPYERAISSPASGPLNTSLEQVLCRIHVCPALGNCK